MKTVTHGSTARLTHFLAAGALAATLTWPMAGLAQDKTPAPSTKKNASQSTDADSDLSTKLKELKAKAAALEAALMKRYPAAVGKDVSGGKGMGAMGSGGMGMMGGKGMGGTQGTKTDETMGQMMQMMGQMMQMMGQMQGKPSGMGGGGGMMDDDMMGAPMAGGGMMDDDQMEMGSMGGGAPAAGGSMSGGMGMMDDDQMEMMGMGSMGGSTAMGKMKAAAALPGFPGISHIYHIGATGFFLDHPEHIALSSEQKAELNRIQQQALLDKATAQRKIDEAEQELWKLTGFDQPDAAAIEAKIQEIEQLRGEQRLTFIRSVGEAAKVLTEEQRKVLLGQAKPDVHKAHQPATK